MGDNLTDKIKSLTNYLNECTKEYDKGIPIISDEEWDNLYFRLVALEKLASNSILENSPTQTIVYDNVTELAKITHGHPMLSLDKTKSLEEVYHFIHGQSAIAMCKMDGLTCSLKYMNGELVSAETRGNGYVGELVTHNALVIPTIPNRIDYMDEFIVDGEIICTWNDFVEFEDEYKNPRNFAAGSIRLLSSEECAKRHLNFVAWDIIKGFEETLTLSEKLCLAEDLGFLTVPFIPFSKWDEKTIEEDIKDIAKELSFPIDGIVFKFNDIKYGMEQGSTNHHFKNAIAYKFYDEKYPTYLKDIEWTMGRTGTLTPVAIFNPIDIDGSVIERASLHNISIAQETLGKTPHIGQNIMVFKANMIIPQIASADTTVCTVQDLLLDIPTKCPVCGGAVIVQQENESKVLKCINPSCEGKLINRLDHFCGKKGLDIKGISKATFEKLLDWNWITKISDIFELSKYRNEWMKKEGFGEKSVDKILASVESAKHTTDDKFIAGLGIPLVGTTISKLLCSKEVSYFHIREDIEGKYDFTKWDGIGWEIYQSLLTFDYTEADDIWFKYLKDYITNPLWKDPNEKNNTTESIIKDKSIVITGSLKVYKNRAEMQSAIEAVGGKVVGSISKNTFCLINNDENSTSSKNVTAKKLGIPIYNEQTFIEKFLTL